MANAFYKKGAKALCDGTVDYLTDDIKVVLVDTGLYTVNLTTHEFLSDIAAGARIATSANLSGKTIADDAIFDASDTSFANVSGAQSEALVIYRDSGNANTSQLLIYIDTGTNLPVTPTGGDISVIWSNGATKIAQL